ncbi:MAG: 2-phosphosulfolactate phosphatase [Dehalococcoidia bacterium]|nr:2-phosphosulfolactate phosphatase [Dehalococcoidia bacterium]
MEIRLVSLLEGARAAAGVVIIIDVFRAYTTAAVALSRGVEKIVLVAEVEEAIALRERGIGELCVGEVGGMRPEGFDFNNSPSQMAHADIEGKTIIQSTRAGTVGMTAATRAEKLYGGSFAVASATVEAISRQQPELLTIVAMGSEGRIRVDEDEQCALFLKNLFQGRRPDHEAVRTVVLAGEESQKYDDPTKPHFPPEDREMALAIDSHNFAIRVEREDGLLVARQELV